MGFNLPKIVHILGLIAGFLAGIVGIVGAILAERVAYGIWGGIFLVCATLAVIGGATASPRGGLNPPKVGAKYTRVPDWVTYCVMGLFVVGIVFTFIFPPWK